MGLFDNLFGDKSTSNRELSKQEAFAGILLGASACDGHISDEEVQSLFTTTERMKLYENMVPAKWNSMMDSLVKILKKEGPTGLVDRCARALPEGLADTAFANACDMVLADGVVEDEEKEFLDHLQKALGIDGDTALTIVEVMITKNKG
ncbi:tellurite resistance TerB family protein [Zavarzinella formosa]|uniref:tellurite resistance TerB family protein n=1 Tax=Zavarzinella formosa TaxID=360055 RepID=UPI0002D27FBC|nr:tellurite resistance TerB family protein [Zavarzinella formosa]